MITVAHNTYLNKTVLRRRGFMRPRRTELGWSASSPLDVRILLAASTQKLFTEVPYGLLPVAFCLLAKCFGVVSAFCFGVFCEIPNVYAVCFGVSAFAPFFLSSLFTGGEKPEKLDIHIGDFGKV